MGDFIESEHLMLRRAGKALINDVSFSLQRGGIIAFLGESGSGKSALLRVLGGIDRPDGGAVTILGKNVAVRKDSKALRALVGYAPQGGCAAAGLTVSQNLIYTAKIHGLRGRVARQRVDELLAQFSLCEYFDVRAGALSGGFQKRLDLAMACVHRPQLLLLDEPFAGLDPIGSADTKRQIAALAEHCTVIFSWHGPRAAEQLASRVLILVGGELGALGTPRQLQDMTGCDSLQSAYEAVCAQTLAQYLS